MQVDVLDSRVRELLAVDEGREHGRVLGVLHVAGTAGQIQMRPLAVKYS